jgi:hypothetical protein
MLWRAREVCHFALFSIDKPSHKQKGMSLQINKKTVNNSKETRVQGSYAIHYSQLPVIYQYPYYTDVH